MKNAFCFLVCVVSLYMLITPLAHGQEKIRRVERGLQYPDQPIEVINWGLEGKPFPEDNLVLAGPDWLKHLRLSIKNVSEKNIIGFNIDLLVKKQGQILMGIPISFRINRNPSEADAFTLRGESKIDVLRPGEAVRIKVNDHKLRLYAIELKKVGLEDLESVTLDLRGVFFEDHSRWMFGQQSRPDPENPGKRIPIDKPGPISRR